MEEEVQCEEKSLRLLNSDICQYLLMNIDH
jgi:hypothetical protein